MMIGRSTPWLSSSTHTSEAEGGASEPVPEVHKLQRDLTPGAFPEKEGEEKGTDRDFAARHNDES
jgi:hypothetical protein